MLHAARLFATTALALAAVCAPSISAAADAIPYPTPGSHNPVSYSFTATASGDVVAWFVDGAAAGYDNQLGLLVNGVLSAAGYGLDNHASSLGDSFDFGPVNAGDTLVFVLHNLTGGRDAYSDPALNGAYDGSGATQHNHVWSTAYTATSPVFPHVPAGTYVAFEDIAFPGGDYNYRDEVVVVSNVSVSVSAVPEPAGAPLLALGLAALAGVIPRLRQAGRRRP